MITFKSLFLIKCLNSVLLRNCFSLDFCDELKHWISCCAYISQELIENQVPYGNSIIYIELDEVGHWFKGRKSFTVRINWLHQFQVSMKLSLNFFLIAPQIATHMKFMSQLWLSSALHYFEIFLINLVLSGLLTPRSYCYRLNVILRLLTLIISLLFSRLIFYFFF